MIKPFLSSTFRDFFIEREYLFKSCFPLISKKCFEKGLNFIPIDLRWGVTKNQCESGQVIKICLDEIDECRPYFICFLGFRNGWSLIDKNKNDKLLIKTFDFAAKFYQWIYKYKDKSVTELEILHGALLQNSKNLKNNLRCLFYIKSINYLKQQISSNIDNNNNNNNEKYKDFIDFNQAEKNLMKLKENIVNSKYCKVTWFDSCEELSNKLKNDLFEIIDFDFPFDLKEINENNKEIFQHELYRNLLTNKIYIDINNISIKLNKFIYNDKNKNILIIYGECGIGKSTILSYFDKNQRNNSSIMIISRYIGITIESNTIISLLKSIINEIYDKYKQLKQEININNNNYDENNIYDITDYLYKLFDKILNIYSKLNYIIIIFDSINEFLYKDKDEFEFLNLILNYNINPKIKIILSTTLKNKYNQQNNNNNNNVKIIKLEKMNKNEILQFTKNYLSQYGKVFDEKQKSLIIKNEKTVSNPLFLTIFLEEMRCFGSFENLNEYILSYINVKSIEKLFEKVMIRFENQFKKFNNLLIHILLFLYYSRNGLFTNELQFCLKELNYFNQTFPIFEYLSLIHQLINLHFIKQICGKYIIIHQFVKNIIYNKYLSNNNNYNHKKYLIIIYKIFNKLYKTNNNNQLNQRFINQVPYYLYILINDYKQNEFKNTLKNVISDIQCIKYMKLSQNIYDFHKYWNIIQSENISIDTCFKKKLNEIVISTKNNYKQIVNYYHDIAIFMIDTGRYYNDIEYFLKQCLKYYKIIKNIYKQELIIFELAKLYQKQNKFDKSLIKYQESIFILKKLTINDNNNNNNNNKELKLKLLIRECGLGSIQKELNEWENAIKTYEKCVKNKIKLLNNDNNHPLIAIDLINISNIYLLSNKNKYIEKSLKLTLSAKEIFENNFGINCLQLSMVYSLLGKIYQFKQKYNLSIKYLKIAKDIKINKFGSKNINIVPCLNNLGNVYLKLNDMENSLLLFKNAYNLIINNNDNDYIQSILCHNNLSNYYLINKKYNLALKHLIECKDIIINNFGKYHYKLIKPLLNLANIYNQIIKDYQKSEIFYKQILKIIINNNDNNNNKYNKIKIECFNGLSYLYLNHYNDYNQCIKYIDKQYNLIMIIYKNINNNDKIIDILYDKVCILIKQNNYLNAWQILQKILKLISKNITTTITTNKLLLIYNICGNVMLQLNRQNDAIKYYEKEFLIKKENVKNQNINKQYMDLIQLLAILHFGNENLIQSEKYFKLYKKISNDIQQENDIKDIDIWLNDIKQAHILLSA